MCVAAGALARDTACHQVDGAAVMIEREAPVNPLGLGIGNIITAPDMQAYRSR